MTVMVLVIVAQDDVSNWNVIAPVELVLEPLHRPGAAVVTVDEDDALSRQYVGAELAIRTPAKHMF